MDAAYADGQTWLAREYPDVASGFLPALPEPDPALLELGREVYACLGRKCRDDGRPIHDTLDALVHMSVDFLRLQPAFMKTGRYAGADEPDMYARVYGNAAVMDGHYLDGLLLTYAFWTNHARILRFFVDDFVADLPDAAQVAEIGVGHGLLALFALSRRRQATYLGLDLSPLAVRYADGLLRANDIAMHRVSLLHQDATAGLPMMASRDAIWCGEVLEHVRDPRQLLYALRGALARDGAAFVTTVANVEAEDHIYRFEDAAAIRTLLNECGFSVQRELVLPIRGFEQATPLPLNYAAVLRRSDHA